MILSLVIRRVVKHLKRLIITDVSEVVEDGWIVVYAHVDLILWVLVRELDAVLVITARENLDLA